jgi:hypothetical protein
MPYYSGHVLILPFLPTMPRMPISSPTRLHAVTAAVGWLPGRLRASYSQWEHRLNRRSRMRPCTGVLSRSHFRTARVYKDRISYSPFLHIPPQPKLPHFREFLVSIAHLSSTPFLYNHLSSSAVSHSKQSPDITQCPKPRAPAWRVIV